MLTLVYLTLLLCKVYYYYNFKLNINNKSFNFKNNLCATNI